MTTNQSATAPPPATKLKEDAEKPDPSKDKDGEEKMKQLRELARKSLDAAEGQHAENVRLKAELAALRAKEFPPKGATEPEKPTIDPVKDDTDTFPGKEGAVKTPKDNKGTEGALTSKGRDVDIEALTKSIREEVLKELKPTLTEAVAATLKGYTPRPGTWGAMQTKEQRWTKLKNMVQRAITADRQYAGGSFDLGVSEGNFGFKSPASNPTALASTELFVQKMLVDEGVVPGEA